MNKRNFIILSSVVIVLAIIALLFKNDLPEIRMAGITGIKGDYTWICLKGYQQAGDKVPTHLVIGKKPEELRGYDVIPIEWSLKPKYMDVFLWKDGKRIKAWYDHGMIAFPDHKGIYTYEIIGSWLQGSVSYTFYVEVK